jgi:hypothetical protein
MNGKFAGSMAQVVEYLLSKGEVLSSKSRTTTKKWKFSIMIKETQKHYLKPLKEV